MKFIQFIADYGKKDPAFAEVIQRLHMEIPGATIHDMSTYPFSTIETGFWTYQLGLGQHPEGMIIYTNCAPRKDDSGKREKNEGERLVYAKLKNGVEIVGVNSGYSFSFIKNHIAEFYNVDVDNKGSQFRSRDFYPRIVAMVAKGDYSFKLEQLDPAKIVDYPKNVIGAIDGYGNLKTTLVKKDVEAMGIKPGELVKIKIGRWSHTATFVDGTFGVKDGEVSLAEGSSGHDAPFMEIFLRGGSARKRFNKPEPGDTFEISKID
jgi:S-adenosylmethionine hydrolase